VNEKKKKAGVLADHRRAGKRFIPPFFQIPGTLFEVRWVDTILPELLWLGLLNDRYGLAQGAALAVSIARAALNSMGQERRIFFAATSAFTRLSDEQKARVVRSLELSGDLQSLKDGLTALSEFYPKCPLNFIFGSSPSTRPDGSKGNLSWLKDVLKTLFDRWDKPGTLVQANAVYMAFVSDMLKVAEGLSLANFPAVAEFPDTEESQRVASGCRAMVTTVFGDGPWYDKSASWPRYFWNRGLELDPCEIQGLSDE
jgi:hypothetical protein